MGLQPPDLPLLQVSQGSTPVSTQTSLLSRKLEINVFNHERAKQRWGGHVALFSFSLLSFGCAFSQAVSPHPYHRWPGVTVAALSQEGS